MPKAVPPVCIGVDVQEFKGPGHADLQAHKERIVDKLQGLLTTVDKLPSILHSESAQVRAARGARGRAR